MIVQKRNKKEKKKTASVVLSVRREIQTLESRLAKRRCDKAGCPSSPRTQRGSVDSHVIEKVEASEGHPLGVLLNLPTTLNRHPNKPFCWPRSFDLLLSCIWN